MKRLLVIACLSLALLGTKCGVDEPHRHTQRTDGPSSPVPEPSAVLLFPIGLAAFAWARRGHDLRRGGPLRARSPGRPGIALR